MVEQNNFKRLRKKQGFSIMELAASTGVSTATLVGVERYGLYPGPSVRERLAKKLGVPEASIWPSIEAVGSDGK